jgi:hypothetical protein
MTRNKESRFQASSDNNEIIDIVVINIYNYNIYIEIEVVRPNLDGQLGVIESSVNNAFRKSRTFRISSAVA